ncbi:sugar ABC transporter substrate-binding protein [Halobacteriales archaeon QS_5_70_17]|nr:MAG: sugar ABC transporter substrate-binding protein [Halobacteriales archaeon QS_5_70_17]
MGDNSSREESQRRPVSRRQFVKAAGATGVVAGLAGCAGGDGGDGNGSGNGSGGGSTGGGSGSVSITWATDPNINDNWGELEPVLRDAGGLPDNIDVEINALPQDSGQRQSQLQQWLGAQRSSPEVLHMDVGWTIPYIGRDQTLNLTEALGEERANAIKENHFDAQIKSLSDPETGDIHGVPVYPDFPIMHYRKDLVEEAGYTPEEDGWSTDPPNWEEFSQVAKETMEQTGTETGFTWQAKAYEGLACCDFNEFITAFGGAYFGNPEENLTGPLGERPITVTDEPVMTALEMGRTFIEGTDGSLEGYASDISPASVLQWIENPSLAPFTDGNAVMHRNWPYAIVESESNFEDFENMYGNMPIPGGVSEENAQYPGTGGPVSSLGGWNLTVNPYAQGDQKEASLELAKAITADEFRLKMFEVNGWVPAKPELFNSDRARQVEPTGQFLDTLQVSGENAMPRPVTVAWPQQSSQIAQSVNGVFSGSNQPGQAMEDLKNTLDQIEQEYAQG